MATNFKLKVLAAAVLMASSMAHAGSALLNGVATGGDGSVSNPYNMGVMGAAPTALAVQLGGTGGMFFEEFANFTIPLLSDVSGVGNTYNLSLTFGAAVIDLVRIDNLQIEVWNDSHPFGSTLYAIFSGNNVTNSIGILPAGSYHLDISGSLGTNVTMGQYSVALQALPVPEPETYAMLLAGLGLIGFSLSRRKTI